MSDTKTTAIARVEAPRPNGLMRPVVKPAELIEAHKEAADVIRDALEDGRDYGKIPGAGERKVLLKAGAERLCVAFGLRPSYTIIDSEVDHDREVMDRYGKKARGLYRFVVKCELFRDDHIVGEGIGSCSTMESKYVSRPRDCENTALKMGKKRALVDAVLTTLSLSDRFSQDVGDPEHDDDRHRQQQPVDDDVYDPPVTDATRKAIGAALDTLGIGKGIADDVAAKRARGEYVASFNDKNTPKSEAEAAYVLRQLNDRVEAKRRADLADQALAGVPHAIDHD